MPSHNKLFYVIVYDISSDKTRDKVMKTLRSYGARSNLSVFECLLTEKELLSLMSLVSKIIDPKTDKVAYYRMCLGCYSKIQYTPEMKRKDVSSSIAV